MELRKLWEILKRRKRLYIQSMVIIMISVLITIIIIRPLYNVTAKILIKPTDIIPQYITNMPDTLGRLTFIDTDKVIDTYKNMLELVPVNNKVLKDLVIKDRFGKPIHVSDFVNPNIIKIVYKGKGVKITQENDSEIFAIIGISSDINEAVNIANSIKNSFIEFYNDLNRKEAKYAIELIEARINDTKLKLETLEEQKYKYDREMQVADLSTQRSYFLDQISSLEKKRAEFSVHYTPEHPDVKVVQNQIDEMYRKLDKFISYSLNFNRIQREIDNQTTVYQTLIKQLEYARIASNINVSSAQVIQKAEFLDNDLNPYKYFPKRKLILFIAFVLGNLFTLSLVFLREYIDNTIRNKDDLEMAVSAPVIESIFIKDIHTGERPFWNIESQLELLSGGMPRVFAVISTSKGEGKSFVASKLAKVMAEKGYRTLLIDFNLRAPSIANLIRISHDKGLIDWLSGKSDLKEIIFPSEKKNLDIIPSGKTEIEPLRLIKSEKIIEMVESLKQIYDIIIYDTAALEDYMDTMIVSTALKKVLFVAYQGKALLDVTGRYVSMLRESNVEILGTIFISK